MSQKYVLDKINNLKIDIKRPALVFLYGDLGAGKTTLSQYLIQENTQDTHEITSPTYVYYNKYEDVYHFDLYRCKDYDEFVSIGGEEILDNNEGIILIEWPEILKKYYKSDVQMYLEKTDVEGERRIDIKYK